MSLSAQIGHRSVYKMSNFRDDSRRNRADMVFDSIPVGQDEASLFGQYVAAHDLAANTRKAFTQDVRKFARWFASANSHTESCRARSGRSSVSGNSPNTKRSADRLVYPMPSSSMNCPSSSNVRRCFGRRVYRRRLNRLGVGAHNRHSLTTPPAPDARQKASRGT